MPASYLSTGPIANVSLPTTPLVRQALEYIQIHLDPTTINHVMRSSFFALVAASKMLDKSAYQPETIVLATILHDLGWSQSPELISSDKRFEVDGAIAAVKFIKTKLAAASDEAWSADRIQRVWDAIALHTTPSIATYKEPEVAMTCLGILADFWGPNTPGGFITADEFKAVMTAYPRLGFKDSVIGILCGLCKTKPDTTWDNFVGEFGCANLDGFKAEWDKHRASDMLVQGLALSEQYET